MQIVLNEWGFVENYALIGNISSSIDVVEPDDINDFESNYGSYYLAEDGKLVKNNVRQIELENKQLLKELRYQREKQCFPIVNRGELWYGQLGAEQKEELNVWYQNWLDVTETKVVPVTPSWLH